MSGAQKTVFLMVSLLIGAVAAAAAPTSPGPVQPAASPVTLIPHRAIYRLELMKTRHGRFMQSLNGWMLYDFSGNPCDGYLQHVHQISALDAGEGDSAVNDLSSTTWENGAATSFRFNSQSTLDRKSVESVDGKATQDSKGLAVDLIKPHRKNFRVAAGAVFPTEQIRRIIGAARAGQNILPLPVYDGTENGEKIFDTLTVIGRRVPAGTPAKDDAAATQNGLAKLARWPISISYFDRAAKKGDNSQDYSVEFELYENGISRALVLDYNDYVVSGTMVALKLGELKACR